MSGRHCRSARSPSAARLERCKSASLADIVLAFDRIVTRVGINDEAICRCAGEHDREGPVLGRVSRPGRENLMSLNLTTKSAGNFL